MTERYDLSINLILKYLLPHKDWRVLRKRICHLCLSSPYKYPLHRVLESYIVLQTLHLSVSACEKHWIGTSLLLKKTVK